uniref:Putative ovule protein n=1 Tax=Solanum chacoense TaxID=4108 RepID=A0A0V0H4K7_SOLCH
MREFSEIIEDLELVDPPLFGGQFTWDRGMNHNCSSRCLDMQFGIMISNSKFYPKKTEFGIPNRDVKFF